MALGLETRVMGILNVTPDSFSDGGLFTDPATAVDHGLRMLDEGADLIDIGGESTRPNATPVAANDEQVRVLPVLDGILKARPGAVVSIDTYHAETARLAVDAGAAIINDVSGHLWDPEMSATCAQTRAGAVLMHTRGKPQEWRLQPALASQDVLPLVLRELKERADAALAAGVHRNAMALDPGFGFGKILDENYPLLAGLEALHALGFPLVAGLSRKSFLTRAAASTRSIESLRDASRLGLTPERAALATEVANTAAILAGAHILRVHDVAAARQTANIADRILNAMDDLPH
jgi:dihydropteroate synthase